MEHQRVDHAAEAIRLIDEVLLAETTVLAGLQMAVQHHWLSGDQAEEALIEYRETHQLPDVI